MLKKIVSCMLATVLVLSMAGCGSAGTSPEGTSPEAQESEVVGEGTEEVGEGPKAIDFWLDKLDDQSKIGKISAAWKEEAGVDVMFSNYPDVAAYQTAMQQTIDTDAAPALFTWWSGSQLETLAKNGKIEDLTDEWDAYLEAGVVDVREAFTVDGKIYAAPYSVLYNVCYYNKNVFEAAGVDGIPTTFDEFLDACEKIKQSGVTPIGIKNDSWASFIWFQQMISVFDAQLYKDICSGEKDYTDPEVKEVMNKWKEMIDKGYFSEPLLYSDMFRDFATGNVGIILEPTTTANDMESEYGLTPAQDFDAFALPTVDGSKKTIFFEAAPIVVAAASGTKEAGKEALKGLYKENVQNVFTAETGIVNSTKVQVENAVIQNIMTMSGDTEGHQLILRYYENTEEDIRNYALDELSRFMYSGADIDEVLGNIQAKADEVRG